MHLEHTDEQNALRAELRAYFSKLMTPELLEATHGNEGGDAYRSVIRQIGKDGWLALGWPKAFGGQGRGPIDQMIFFEEAQLARAPLPFVSISTVAPAIMAHGSAAHQKKILPEIAAGKLHFAIGYSEPAAGTDLAALKTKAVRDGDNWIINGTKIFTSSAEAADYVWLAARTDPDAAKPHHGITIFMMDAKQPGFSITPIHTVGDVRTNVTYYEDVICPHDMICGEVNSGWKLITSQLNHERVGLAALAVYGWRIYDGVISWARQADTSGALPIDKPYVKAALAEAIARLQALRLMNWRMAYQMEYQEPDPAYSAAIKTSSTEGLLEVYRLLMSVLGPAGILHRDSARAALQGDLEEHYRKAQINTFGGGVTEVLRDMIAHFGLGLSGYRR